MDLNCKTIWQLCRLYWNSANDRGFYGNPQSEREYRIRVWNELMTHFTSQEDAEEVYSMYAYLKNQNEELKLTSKGEYPDELES